MKYKWKDKVRIKSKKELECISEVTDDMLKNGGAIMTIACLVEDADGYIMKEDGDFHFLWSDEMIEGLAEEENNDCEKCGLIRNSTRCLFMDNCPHNQPKNTIEIPEGWVLKDENGNVINATKIVLEKKKKEYPKTYEECIGKLPINWDSKVEGYKCDLLTTFQKLFICRDVYWKIAGDEMGLGRPWELSIGIPIYYIYYNRTLGTIKKDYADDIQGNVILAFPTAEMRDTFKENFDPDIEFCKELL